MAIKGIKMNIQKTNKKIRKTNEPQINAKCKIRQIEIKQKNRHTHTNKTKTKKSYENKV